MIILFFRRFLVIEYYIDNEFKNWIKICIKIYLINENK